QPRKEHDLMSKSRVSQPSPIDNGLVEEQLGDAAEPEQPSGQDTFEVADFEEPIAEPVPPSASSTPRQLDIYDPVNMGLAQDFESVVGAAEKPSIIKVEKPGKARVFRVHSDPTFRVKTMLLVNKDDNELFYVAPCMRKALKNDLLCGDYTL